MDWKWVWLALLLVVIAAAVWLLLRRPGGSPGGTGGTTAAPHTGADAAAAPPGQAGVGGHAAAAPPVGQPDGGVYAADPSAGAQPPMPPPQDSGPYDQAADPVEPVTQDGQGAQQPQSGYAQGDQQVQGDYPQGDQQFQGDYRQGDQQFQGDYRQGEQQFQGDYPQGEQAQGTDAGPWEAPVTQDDESAGYAPDRGSDPYQPEGATTHEVTYTEASYTPTADGGAVEEITEASYTEQAPQDGGYAPASDGPGDQTAAAAPQGELPGEGTDGGWPQGETGQSAVEFDETTHPTAAPVSEGGDYGYDEAHAGAAASGGFGQGAYGPGSAEPAADGSGPDGWQIKGNSGSMLFHTPDSPSYEGARAEVWFESEEAARAAGFAHWDRKRR